MSARGRRAARVVSTLAGLITLTACVGACGGGGSSSSSGASTCSAATTFPASSLTSVATDGSKLHVELRSAPSQPLLAGLDCVELTVTDPATGAAVDGLDITMTPWMPAMGHGASVTPQVTALGGGKYVFTDLSLFMPGEWQLQTQFSGEVSDRVTTTFNVE
jgi:hypothetical protein